MYKRQSKDTASSTAGPAPLNKLNSIQKSGKLVVALEGAWQPWSYHDASDTLVDVYKRQNTSCPA